MFFATCALATLTRAIENILFALRETLKIGAIRRAYFRRRARRAAAEPAVSDSDAPDTNAFLYRVVSAFGKFSKFCCLCATVAKPQFWHGQVTLTAAFHSESHKGSGGGAVRG